MVKFAAQTENRAMPVNQARLPVHLPTYATVGFGEDGFKFSESADEPTSVQYGLWLRLLQ